MNKYKKWIDKNIETRNFKGKNIFITGGNSGIGFELAKHCAYLGANIFLLCRSTEKAEKAMQEILKNYPEIDVKIIRLDLADFDSIKSCISEVKNYKIDAFVNNAGVYHLPKSYTKQKLEIIMGTNYIGTYYLNELLLKELIKNESETKIVFETSITSKSGPVNVDDLFMEKDYKMMRIYARSKTCLNAVYFTYLKKYELFPKLSFSLMHPGVVYTPLISKGYKNKVFAKAAQIFMKTFFHSAEKAALILLKSINDKSRHSEFGPSGFVGASGYPKHWKIKEPKNIEKIIEKGSEIIEKSI